MGDLVYIRQAELSDLQDIVNLVGLVAPYSFPDSAEKEEIQNWLGSLYSSYKIQDKISDPQTTFLVATRQERIIGSGFLSIKQAHSIAYGYIGGLYCLEQGQGVGSSLMDTLLLEAKTQELPQARMIVGEENFIMQKLAMDKGFQRGDYQVDPAGFFRSRFAEWQLALL